MNLINLSATLNMHNYLFKNIFKVLAKFICTYVCYTSTSFLTRKLRACARASYRYDVGNGIRSLARSLDWSIPVNFF